MNIDPAVFTFIIQAIITIIPIIIAVIVIKKCYKWFKEKGYEKAVEVTAKVKQDIENEMRK